MTELRSTETNSTDECIQLNWVLPAESGADRFKIAYGNAGTAASSMEKMEVNSSEQSLQLCSGIVPGQSYLLTVVAEKRNQLSDASTITYTVRPRSPRELEVVADFQRVKFKVEARLSPLSESLAEKCHISVVSEHLEKMEQTVKVESVESGPPVCTAYLDLVPGRRYEFSAAALSSGASSTKIFLNKALEPGFDFGAFGLQLDEEANGTRLHLSWPDSDVSLVRIEDTWAKIVGNSSRLHFNVTPYGTNGTTAQSALTVREAAQQMETTPAESKRLIVVDHLRQGACYRVGDTGAEWQFFGAYSQNCRSIFTL